MVIASSPGCPRSRSTDRQLLSPSSIPSTQERSGSPLSGHFEHRGKSSASATTLEKPSRLGWRPIRGGARDVPPHPNGGSHASIITCMHMQIIVGRRKRLSHSTAPIASQQAKRIHAISAAIGIVEHPRPHELVAMPSGRPSAAEMLPTPAIAPAMAWVVETGSPKLVPAAPHPPPRFRRRIRCAV